MCLSQGLSILFRLDYLIYTSLQGNITFSVASHVIGGGSCSTMILIQKEGVEFPGNAYSTLKHFTLLIQKESIDFKIDSKSRKSLLKFYFNV